MNTAVKVLSHTTVRIPACKDYSEEYQALYHMNTWLRLPVKNMDLVYILWNMFDFGCAARDEGGVAGKATKVL